MTDFVVIRHGETDWNREHRFQGQIDVPLNAIGQQQAQRLATALAGERVDLLLSSDLQRARQTALPLERTLARTAQVQPGFREQGFGVLEGLDVPTIKTRHPELWAQWLRHDADYALPSGESVRQFHARVLAALRDLAREHAGNCGGVNRVGPDLMRQILELGQVSRFQHLVHGHGERDRTYSIETEVMYGSFEIGNDLACRVIGDRVGQLQQFTGNQGLHADGENDFVERDVMVLQRVAHHHRRVHAGWEVDFP